MTAPLSDNEPPGLVDSSAGSDSDQVRGLAVRLTLGVYVEAVDFWHSLSEGVWPPSPPCGRWKL